MKVTIKGDEGQEGLEGLASPVPRHHYLVTPYFVTLYGLPCPFRMKPIALKFGGYQEPASIHNRAAGRFGELLKRKLGGSVGSRRAARQRAAAMASSFSTTTIGCAKAKLT